MNEEEFENIIEGDRKRRIWTSSDIHDDIKEKKFAYKPYLECPRCSEWQLAAHTHQEKQKESNGFLRGSETKWPVIDRWWQCKNCEAKFDVDCSDEEDSNSGHQSSREYILQPKRSLGPASVRLLKQGSVPGIVHKDGMVKAERVTSQFHLPDDVKLDPGTEVLVEMNEGEVFCVEQTVSE